MMRGRLSAGETVLVHGAAGGVGTASIQVAKGLGARTIAVVSSDEKEQVAREAGADEVVRSRRRVDATRPRSSPAAGWTSSSTRSAATASPTRLRSLAEGGRLVVVGFTGGSIPEVKVNRLLLNNTEVIGAGWGAYVIAKPELNRRSAAELGEADRIGRRAPARRRALPARGRRCRPRRCS